MLKSTQTVEDAKKCVEVGVQGIVVNNHGGRQQDGGISSLGMLPRIVDAVRDKLEILFDSGVRCGADIAKALALGAKVRVGWSPVCVRTGAGWREGRESNAEGDARRS